MPGPGRFGGDAPHCMPIISADDIPAGQRACRVWDLSCPECAQRKLLIEDFLRVQDTEVVEERNIYSSDLFLGFYIFKFKT